MDVSPMTPARSRDDGETQWALQHAAAVATDEAGSPWPDVIAEHGSIDAFLAGCRERRSADAEMRMARVVIALMREAPGKPRGTLRPPERGKLLADRPLAAFFSSVAAAGDDGWRETNPIAADCYAIKALLPTWRQWGRVLLEAGAIEMDGAFLPPSWCNA